MEKNNLIESIKTTMDMYNLDSVMIFINKKATTKSFGPAFALKEALLLEEIDTDVIVTKETKINMKEGYPEVILEPKTKHFLSICVDCKKESEIECDAYKNSLVLFDVFGPLVTKGFGVLNFKASAVSCTAEVLFNELSSYYKKTNQEFPKEVAQWLYIGMLGGTKRFGTNIKKNTLLTAKTLLDLGVDYKMANHFYEKKTTTSLRAQEIILNHTTEYPHCLCAKIPYSSNWSEMLTEKNFADALEYFKNIDRIYVTCIMLERNDGTYKVFWRASDYYNCNVEYLARKAMGEGDEKFATAIIQAFDPDKVAKEAHQYTTKIHAYSPLPKLEDDECDEYDEEEFEEADEYENE